MKQTVMIKKKKKDNVRRFTRICGNMLCHTV